MLEKDLQGLAAGACRHDVGVLAAKHLPQGEEVRGKIVDQENGGAIVHAMALMR